MVAEGTEGREPARRLWHHLGVRPPSSAGTLEAEVCPAVHTAEYS